MKRILYLQKSIRYQDKFSSSEVDDKTIHVSLNDETIQTFFAAQIKDDLAIAMLGTE